MSDPQIEKIMDRSVPPFGKKWGYWYIAVLGWLAILIVLFILFTRTYNY
jgi:hypothetical protein